MTKYVFTPFSFLFSRKLISHRHSVSSGQITDAQKALHEIPQQPKRPAPTPPERRSTRPQSVKMRRAPQPPKQSSVGK